MLWKPADRPDLTVSVTGRALTIAHGDMLVVAWDRGGRLYSVWDGGRTCRRGLNGRVLATWREQGLRQHAWMGEDEAAALVNRAAAAASDVRARHAGLKPCSATGDAPDLAPVLARAAAFDAAAATADAAAFRAVYRPIGILPPDQYLSLVLQATEGCSFRTCTFCDFYAEPYRVKSATQFAAHLRAVVAYLGESIRLRDRAVFLGSANALAVPMSGLLPIFDVLAAEWPGRPVHAFVDGFTGTLKTAGEYRALADRGLRRVYIGLESGCDALLEFVCKPATSAQAIDSVRAAKAGGAGVGVIVMLGLGGDRFAAAHVADTARVINAMALGAGDLLYFSELVEWPGSPYVGAAAAADVRPLDCNGLAAQRAAIEARLAFQGARPRIATYNVREFVY